MEEGLSSLETVSNRKTGEGVGSEKTVTGLSEKDKDKDKDKDKRIGNNTSRKDDDKDSGPLIRPKCR